MKQEPHVHGLNLKIKGDELSRQGTSSIDAHSSERGKLAATSSSISVLRGSEMEWGAAFSCIIVADLCLQEVFTFSFIDRAPNLRRSGNNINLSGP
jgi:hypothetical protein